MTCKKCKKICAHCEFFLEATPARHAMCRATEHQVTNCITGEKELKYVFCVEKNKDGDCPNFKMDKKKQVMRTVINALEKFGDKVVDYEGYGYAPAFNGEDFIYLNKIQRMLLRNLLASLKGEETDFEYWTDIDEDFCGDSDDYIIYDNDIRKYPSVYKKYQKWKEEQKE